MWLSEEEAGGPLPARLEVCDFQNEKFRGREMSKLLIK